MIDTLKAILEQGIRDALTVETEQKDNAHRMEGKRLAFGEVLAVIGKLEEADREGATTTEED